MNAMAQHGAVRAAPEIVIVNDGKPVESVSTGQRAATIGKYAAIGLVPLILGIMVGQAAKSGNIANASVRDVKGVARNVEDVTSKLGELKTTLEAAGPSVREKATFDEVNAAFEKIKTDLKNLASIESAVYKANLTALGPTFRGQTVQFYSSVQEILDLLDEHQKTRDLEEAAMKAATARLGDKKLLAENGSTLASAGFKYKVALMIGEQGPQLVELGAALCGGDFAASSVSDSGICAENAPPVGFLYRINGERDWSKGKLNPPGGGADKLPTGELILLTPSGSMDALVEGADAALAREAYVDRYQLILERTRVAYKIGEELGPALKKAGNQGEKFTFFL